MQEPSLHTDQLWEVTGGIGKGGVLVREGRHLNTSLQAERLATGAVVRQLELIGDRLHYQLLQGGGPDSGWVSIKIQGTELLVKSSRTAPSLSQPSHSSQSRSLQKVDTKLNGTIDPATLDSFAKGSETLDDNLAVKSETLNIIGTDSYLEDLVRKSGIPDLAMHVVSIVHNTPDLRVLTPKFLVLELAEKHGIPVDELKVHMALIKHVAQRETKRMLSRLMEAPIIVEPIEFSLPSKPARRDGRKQLELGSIEAHIADLVLGGGLEEASQVLSKRIDQFTGSFNQTHYDSLVTRGHVHWANSRYAKAHEDFLAAEELQPGGPAGSSLLVLRFCLGLHFKPDEVVGHHDLKKIVAELTLLFVRVQNAIAERRHLFHPRSAISLMESDRSTCAAGSDMEIFDGVCTVEAYDDHPEVHIGYRILHKRAAEVSSSTDQHPLLIYFHGNGEVCEDYTQWAAVYEKFPSSFLVFDYRGYGWSTGKPCMECLTKDPIICMYKLGALLESHKLPWPWPAPVVLMGRSLGVQVVGSLIGQFPEMFDGLICESGGANTAEEHYQGMLDACGASRNQATAAFEAMRSFLAEDLPLGCPPVPQIIAPHGTCEGIRGYRGPVLILHGAMDSIVPLDHGRRNYESANNASRRDFVEIQADHNSMAGVVEFWQKQVMFVRKLVKRPLQAV